MITASRKTSLLHRIRCIAAAVEAENLRYAVRLATDLARVLVWCLLDCDSCGSPRAEGLCVSDCYKEPEDRL